MIDLECKKIVKLYKAISNIFFFKKEIIKYRIVLHKYPLDRQSIDFYYMIYCMCNDSYSLSESNVVQQSILILHFLWIKFVVVFFF